MNVVLAETITVETRESRSRIITSSLRYEIGKICQNISYSFTGLCCLKLFTFFVVDPLPTNQAAFRSINLHDHWARILWNLPMKLILRSIHYSLYPPTTKQRAGNESEAVGYYAMFSNKVSGWTTENTATGITKSNSNWEGVNVRGLENKMTWAPRRRSNYPHDMHRIECHRNP